ncbi:MAG TPA: hydrogen peroxide-inducible genes activator [Alphaproteobacteria bacterium]|nr:hydrogen peroxide-inducible genes activator [Alphaproteobacteria bacterium]
MMNLPTLRQLQHLVALAEERHFGRAAARSSVTQSSLSASIKELETGLEAALVDRTKRKVVLTPLGLETVARARRVIAEAEELARAARAAQAPLSGDLHLGVIPTIGPYLLPTALPKLRRKYPKLRLFLVEDLTARLVRDLEEGKLDAILLALPYACGNVETRILFEDRFLAALPHDHPLAKAREIEPASLAAPELLLLQDGHCLRDHALAACSLAGPRYGAAVEATSLPTLVQMVDNGLGVTLLPELAIDAGILRGTRLVTRPLAGTPPVRKIGLVWRRGTGRQEEFELLAQELAALAPKHAAKGG